jgi:hypothetical protein
VDDLIVALAPGFVAGFGVQRVLELGDAVLGRNQWIKDHKAPLAAAVSIALGFLFAWVTNVRVLKPLAGTNPVPDVWDLVLTALVVSAGTEGMNSILKYLGYKKDSADEDSKAKEKKNVANTEATEAVAGLAAKALTSAELSDHNKYRETLGLKPLVLKEPEGVFVPAK